jgi:O6-methylguanine-DNA--protein-cysteine methyltransferase
MRGDLDEDKSHPIPRVVWKGERYPVIDMSLPSAAEVYYAQPWEKEAFAKHDELFRKVTLSIPSAERAAVADEFESRHNIGDVRDVRDVREMIDMLRAVAAAVAINPLI